MNEFNHESSLIAISATTAKENKKQFGRLVLYIAIALSCSIAPVTLLIYFIVKANAVGIIAFSATIVVVWALSVIALIKFIPAAKECKRIVSDYENNGEKLKKDPALDVFCVTAVKIMFSILSAVLVCAIPSAITVCWGMSFGNILTYLTGCLGAFWGFGAIEQDFFTHIIGTGIMACIFALILLLIKYVNKMLK